MTHLQFQNFIKDDEKVECIRSTHFIVKCVMMSFLDTLQLHQIIVNLQIHRLC